MDAVERRVGSIKAEVEVHWQMFSALAAGIGAPDETGDAKRARCVVCRNDLAAAFRGNELRRVTTAPRLLLDGVAAPSAASTVRRSR
jgi:hypothetical protein